MRGKSAGAPSTLAPHKLDHTASNWGRVPAHVGRGGESCFLLELKSSQSCKAFCQHTASNGGRMPVCVSKGGEGLSLLEQKASYSCKAFCHHTVSNGGRMPAHVSRGGRWIRLLESHSCTTFCKHTASNGGSMLAHASKKAGSILAGTTKQSKLPDLVPTHSRRGRGVSMNVINSCLLLACYSLLRLNAIQYGEGFY